MAVLNPEISSTPARRVSRRTFLTTLAAGAGAVLTVLGLDRVISSQPPAAAVQSAPDNLKQREGDKMSPAARATVNALAAKSAANNAEIARTLQDSADAYKAGLTDPPAMIGATPLPLPTPDQGTPAGGSSVSSVIDGAEVKPTETSVTNTITQPSSNPTPALRVDAGGNFGGEVNAAGK